MSKYGVIDERINCFNIQDIWIENKDIQKYLRSNYNNGKPILTRKRLKDCFFYFKEGLINGIEKNNFIYNLLLNI